MMAGVLGSPIVARAISRGPEFHKQGKNCVKQRNKRLRCLTQANAIEPE